MLRKKCKKVLMLATALFMIVGLAAVFAGGQREGTPESKTVTVWYMNAANYQQPYRDLWAKFGQEHPDVKLEPVALGWSDFGPKLQAAFAGGTEPNVIEVPPTFVQDQIYAGKLAEVPDKAVSSSYRKEFFPFTLEMWQRNGKQYGMPLNCYLPGSEIMYNQAAFKEVGIVPKDDWMWTDFVKDMRKLVIMDGDKFKRRALTFRMGNPVDIWFSWTFQFGGGLVTPDGKKSLVTADASRQAFQAMIDILLKYKLDDYRVTPEIGNVVEGTLAASVAASYMDGIRQNNYPNSPEFGWFLLPAVKPGAARTWASPASFGRCVSLKGSTDAAWTYYGFMMQKENLFYFDLHAAEPMPIMELNTRPEVAALSKAITTLIPVIPLGKAPGPIWDSQEWNTLLVAAMDAVVFQGADVNSVLQKAQDQADKLITKYRAKYGIQ
jgi:ABC-type glycerol-3-phosphate transport system substrate-binding protein